MTGASADREAFARLIHAIAPYLDEVVFVGGWAHRLFAFHELAGSIDFEPLATDDADIAAPIGLRSRTQSLAERLKQAGFQEEFRDDDTPPITEYRLGQEDTGLYVEFLAPLVGGPFRRDGTPKDTTLVGGVTAQTLRHVDLLLDQPWQVRVTERQGFPVGAEGVQLKIANPASFIAQKLLVLEKRALEKRPKDILYVHDTFLLFGEKLDALRSCWERTRAQRHPNVQRDLVRIVEARFGVVDDLVRAASRIALESGRPAPPTPERLRSVCRAGLQHLLDEP